MLKLENHLGTTTITTEYFAGLIGNVVSSCYGVVGISASTPVQGMLRRVSGRSTPAQGVKIKAIGDKLVVDIHIKVLYVLLSSKYSPLFGRHCEKHHEQSPVRRLPGRGSAGGKDQRLC